MKELERGAIANLDEGRMVGHYWLRNAKLAPNPFLQVQIDKTLAAVCDFADSVISGKIKPPSSPEGSFTQILSAGIGGSSLGPQFVAEALAPDNPPLKIRFIDNTDPAGIDHQIAQLGPELTSTLVIVISKISSQSGGTPETRNGLLEVQKAFREAGLDFAKQITATVESILDKENFALEELLDEEEIIQECKALNSRLINFLRDRAHVEQLLRYIVEEPSEDDDSKWTFKFPFIACEIFTCEIDVILKTLIEDEEFMNLLFSFLEPNRSHSALLAGYFSKVVICLMLRKTIPLMHYVQTHQEVLRQLVDLIGIWRFWFG